MDEYGASPTDPNISYAVLELGPADLSPVGTGPDHLRALRWQHQTPRLPHRRVPTPAGPVNPGCTATPNPWHGVVRSIVSQLEHTNDRAGRPPAERPSAYLVIVRSAAAAVVAASPPATAWRPGPVDRAIKIMEADPAAISSTADLARAANVAVRTLQSAFRQHTGNSPMQYLRELRLSRVHQDLIAADPQLHTVAKIAHRQGFTHLGRFAAAYRGRYGRNPSTTLQMQAASRPPHARQRPTGPWAAGP